MSAQITNVISSRNYELIRDQLVEILGLELSNQATLQGISAYNLTIYKERTVTINESELPVGNVVLAQVPFDNASPGRKDANPTIYVEFYTSAQNTADDRADETGAVLLTRLLAMAEYIISHPAYKTLGFQPGSIGQVTTDRVIINNPGNLMDGHAAQMGRLAVTVRVLETTSLQPVVVAEGYDTRLRLQETDKGYNYTSTPSSSQESGGSQS